MTESCEACLRGASLALLTVAVSLGIFMNVLDTSIANVAIPTLSGDLGVSPDEGTWVITSFAVSTAIALPLTGWLGKRFGEVRLFVASVLGFTLFSWLCGLAGSLATLVLFRVLQGAMAGPMIPLSQSLLLMNYPDEKKGLALAIWSLTAVVAPVAGPILGGWITDDYSWPWIFYINVPVGLLSAYVTWLLLRHRETDTARLPVDVVGLGLLIVGVACLQIMLDKGNDLDWFGSPVIVTLAVIAVVALSYFIIWELTERHPVVDLTLFKEINFTVGTVAISLGYMVFFGSIVIFPLWLQTQMGYTATWAGFAAAFIGILALVVSPIVGQLLSKVDLRVLVSFAFIVFAVVSFWNASFDTAVDFDQLVLPRLVFGLGVPCFFIPLIAMSLSGLPPSRVASASGLTNFLRILGGSFGVSLSITLWDRRQSFYDYRLTEYITAYNPVSQHHLEQLQNLGLDPLAASALLARSVSQQAFMLATNDFFWLSGWIFFALLVLVWFARAPFTTAGGGAEAAA
jgi:MFS transporter, DHA2 family, multidrug resistance protein